VSVEFDKVGLVLVDHTTPRRVISAPPVDVMAALASAELLVMDCIGSSEMVGITLGSSTIDTQPSMKKVPTRIALENPKHLFRNKSVLHHSPFMLCMNQLLN
jgi:hypothetical protein